MSSPSRKAALVVLVVIAAFAWGTYSARREVFPFPQLRSCWHAVVGDPTAPARPDDSDGRRPARSTDAGPPVGLADVTNLPPLRESAPKPAKQVKQVIAGEESTRLADLLEIAVIRSPLTEISAASGLEDLADVARRTVVVEGFETGVPDWMNEARPGERGEVAETDGRRALLTRRFARDHLTAWTVPVEPNTLYVFERLVESDAPLRGGFAVIEIQAGSGEPASDSEPQATEGRSLRLHRPTPPDPDGSWQHGSVLFLTTPQTRVLKIVFGKTLGKRDRSAVDHDVWFDDIRLDRVDPTPRQAMALLKAKALAEGADAGLGIHKHGQFPPLGEPTGPHRPEHDNFSHRYALYAPPPTDLGFPLRLEGEAVLRLSVCLSRETLPGHAARFEVLARDDGGEEILWSRTLAAAGDEWRWHDEQIDLAPLRGRPVELVLRTVSEVGSPHPMWGNPIVDVPPRAGDLRNVILIAVDTLRADRMSCYGYPKKTSPHLDAFAADGVRFDQVASNATWTVPSFASIFTGVVASTHHVWSAGPVMPLWPGFETLAERFRARGWATQSIAYKAPLYNGGYEQGFDVAFNVPTHEVRAEDNLAEAMEWLESNADRRNFLFLHFDDPHAPFNQPSPFDRTFGHHPSEQGLSMPLMWTEAEDAKSGEPGIHAVLRGLYDGEVAYVDDRIGAFLEALKSRGLYDDAVIAFVSDHGEGLWEHGFYGHGKDRLHDEVVRVPLIVKPGRGSFARGKVIETQVSGFDIMPTLLELAGIPVEGDLDAQSLVPMLASGAGDFPDRVAVIDASDTDAIAVRSREWKYILRFARAGTSESLYDLRRDPGELVNLARQREGVLQQMRAQALEYCMLHKPGRYLVILGQGSPGDHDYLVQGATSAVPLFGIRPGLAERAAGDALLFRGKAGGPVVAAGWIGVDGPIVVGKAQEPAGDFRRYRRGMLADLVAEGSRGVHLFEGPPHAAEEQTTLQPEDLERIEAMRALGYVGGQVKDH